MLLAEAHALAGLGSSALAYAEEARGFFLETESPDWEIAFIHTIHAHAACVAGEAELHRASFVEAEIAIDAIEDEADREIVLKTLNMTPQPQ